MCVCVCGVLLYPLFIRIASTICIIYLINMLSALFCRNKSRPVVLCLVVERAHFNASVLLPFGL